MIDVMVQNLKNHCQKTATNFGIAIYLAVRN